ncbi:hypothetical protein GOODEAATRI_003218 [Goodea atripinnis]|uniref:Protein kinase domain-containing protein n=1 Tax=Goodea atripinnis TaxID=208336 RepID=A0ABV0MZS4_9TELE
MEHLLNMQQTVLTRLDGLSQDVRGMVRDMASSNEERRGSGIEAICRELHGAVERIESQGCRLEGVEKLVEGTQQVISFIGEVVKSSKLVELLFKQPGNKTSRKAKDDKDKAKHSVKGGKSQKKRKPQDSSDSPSLSESALKEQVEKLNRENTEHSHVNPEADVQSREDAGSGVKRGEELAKLILKGSEDAGDGATGGKRRVTEEDLVKDDLKKSRVEDHVVENTGGQLVDGSKSEEAKPEAKEGGDSAVKEFVIGPPPTAPFDHRIVTPKPHQIATYYTINRDEVLGGVEGGELFDRIIDENYNLTELDTVLFIRQISEGLQYMHKNYILHLDLKVNWFSGLSPFLGDDDNETLNNILACQWNFEEEEFEDISDEAKDFITRLLVKSKSWRMSATESLRHAWLSDRNLHYRLHQKVQKVSYLKAIVSSSIKHGGVCAWELISFVKL